MRLTALVKSCENASCRYRLAAYRPFLEQAGHKLEIRPWPRTLLSGLLLQRKLGHPSAVILQRKLVPAWQLYLVRQAVDFLIYDFDDAVFMRDSYGVDKLTRSCRAQRFASTIRAADAVVAGNDFLRDQGTFWKNGDQVQVVPTCLAATRYPLAQHHRRGAGVRLVWIGSSSTLHGLEQQAPLWEYLGQNWPGLELKVICDRSFSLRYIWVNHCLWSERTETAELADGDIGISWLPDDLWSQGKCGLKVLQYMAAGLPVVANPVGVQADLVRHNETGFHVETPAQWSEAIGRLARDPGLRRRMGMAGRRRVEKDFDVRLGAQRWVALLNQLRKPVALAA